MGWEDYKPIVVMVACQFMYSGMTLSGRAALLEDMSTRVFVVYRQCIAFFLAVPFAYFSRLENVHLRSLRSLAKIVGTVFCVSGAAAMAVMKGPKLLNMEFLPRNSLLLKVGQDTWLLGCSFLFASAFCWSLWLILQVRVSASYPDHLSLTAWMCLIAALQSGVLTLIVEPNMNAWNMNSPVQLFSCFFAGLTSAVSFCGQAWCVVNRGPLFCALLNPLSTVIVMVLGWVFVHEELYSGSVLGGLIVVIGLYVVLWRKAKDHQEVDEDTSEVKKQSDQATLCTEVLDDMFCKTDLEEPLLPKKNSAELAV